MEHAVPCGLIDVIAWSDVQTGVHRREHGRDREAGRLHSGGRNVLLESEGFTRHPWQLVR